MKQRKVETNDRFIAFDEYIGRKYGSELKQLLQDDLYDGYDGSASIRVDRRSAKIESVVYWQDSASEISGIITYSAKSEIDIDGRTEACVSEINIRVDACIGSDRIDCDFTPFHENISKARRQRPEDRLDRYLLPRAGKQRVEEICESILRHYCHDAIVRNEIVAPEDLAKALGLKIIRLPLCDMDNKGSLLITEETFLPVCSTYNKTDFVPTRVDGNTIVINDNCSRPHRNIGNNITHECYHFAGQKLFNLFQKISRAEYPSLGGKRKKHNSDEADTYDWMEWQAFIGSSFLRYPGSYARDEAPGLLKHYAPDSKHDGEMYDSAIRDIADARHLSPFTVCSVLKHQDHIGAKGTFVYVNGEQILPFAFDKVKMMGSYAYTVSFKDLMRLYAENEKLREGLKKGIFVYAGGFVCVNSPEYVRLNEYHMYELTDSARARVDECCLRFHITYSRRDERGYRYGVLFCDEKELTYKSSLAELCDCETGIIGTAFSAYYAIRDLPIQFSDTVKYYREKAGLMEYELADKSGIAEKTVHRIEEGLTKDVSLSIVLRLAKVFKLKATYLSDFLRKARFVPDDSPAGRSLEFIMFYFDRLSVDDLKTAAAEYESILHARSADEAAGTIALSEQKKTPVLPDQRKAAAV